MQKNVRVLVVSDVRLYRAGLEYLLQNASQLQAVMTASEDEDVHQHLRNSSPSVVLLDLAMIDSRSIMHLISVENPNLPVAALAVPNDTDDAIACEEAGFAGYILRDGTVDELIAGLERAMTGELLCSPRVVGTLYRRVSASKRRCSTAPANALTNRESEIAELIEKGFSNKQIANHLRISPSTVKNHVHHILDKLGVHRRTDAVRQLKSRVFSPKFLGDLDQ